MYTVVAIIISEALLSLHEVHQDAMQTGSFGLTPSTCVGGRKYILDKNNITDT